MMKQTMEQTALPFLPDLAGAGIRRYRCDIPATVNTCCHSYEQALSTRGRLLSARIDAGMPRFYYGEPLLIMHLFHDLCEYCLRQDTRGCVVVDLNAEPEGGKLYTISITITISGNGIPRDEEEKHFLPAKMAENKAGDDTVFASLYYVRTICRIFGGDISVRNSPGFGTRFMAKIRLSTIEE